MKNLKITTLKSAIILFLCMMCVQLTFSNEPCKSDNESTALVGLKSFYKSDNGALIYVRQEGSKIYWLAERFDRKFVAVFKGNLKGNAIAGTYYNTPKGKAKGSGSLKVNILNSGNTLKITGGNMDGQLLKSIACPTKFPARRRAHYRGDTKDNLTGRWNASNAGQIHLLDKNNVVAGYFFGQQKDSNDRPSTAKVFFGKRSTTNMNIEWFDIPLGLSYDNGVGKGKATFKIVGPHFLKVIDGFIPGLNHERQTDDKLEILR